MLDAERPIQSKQLHVNERLKEKNSLGILGQKEHNTQEKCSIIRLGAALSPRNQYLE